MNKREFVLGGCGAALATMGPIGQAGASEQASAPPTDLARLEAWQHRLGDEFTVRSAHGGTLTLSEVRVGAQSAGTEQFSLIFSGASTQGARPACTRIVSLPDGRPLALYLEPLAFHPADAAHRYAAHFSTLT
jgi:hypothetical protein